MTVHRPQPDAPLFAPRLRHDARPTSVVAAVKVAPKVDTQIRTILAAIVAAGDRGLNDYEIEKITGIPGNAVRPRRGTLLTKGLIREAGKRDNDAGNPCTVWVAVESKGGNQ